MYLSYQNKLFLITGIVLGIIFTFPLQLYIFSLFVFIPIIMDLEKSERLDLKSFGIFFFGYYLTYNVFIFDLYPMDWVFADNIFYSLIFILLIWILYSLASVFPQIILPNVYNYIFNLLNLRQFNFPIFVLIFILLEHLRSYTVYFFLYSQQTLFGPHYTYGDLGYILTNIPILKNIFGILGVGGATALLLLLNYVFYQIIFLKNYKYIYFLIFIFVALSFPENHSEGVERKIYLANVDLDSDLRSFTTIKDFVPALNLVKDKETLIFLPENLPVLIHKYFVEEYNILASEYLNKKQTTYLLKKGKEEVLHEKKLLMPIGEYKPAIFDLMLHGLIDEKWLVVIGDNSARLTNNYAVMTCSELMSTSLLFEEVDGGGQVIIAPASLRTFNRSRNVRDKTMLYYKARAIEYGRFVIVSGNNRNSLLIDSNGNIIENFTAASNRLIIREVSYKELNNQTIYFKFRKLLGVI